ncbi:MAG: hypothetical protein LBV43_03400 [Prevotella sp.]|jgi:hypothetical protein|nr:hypothetical protein [Prevotella sp.]
MRIVQTFWSGGKNPINDGFGWLKPRYNLMSWALSCLSLRKQYDEVVLYTDSTGYDILINQLKLPYTDVIIEYDNLNCNPTLWAYPKVLTYSLQEKPFIHVDGDVFISRKFRPEIEFADLVSQNRETGTPYYKGMMEAIRREQVNIPEFLDEELIKDSISSYNAGIIGGNDLEFIKEYCDTAFKYIKDNHLDGREGMFINHNILFEQILFYALTKQYSEKRVTTVLDFSVNDNGYTYNDFCDLSKFENSTKFLHILGGHKRNEKTCSLLGRVLLKQYPEYFFRIINLTPDFHKRFYLKNSDFTISKLCNQDDIVPKSEVKKYDIFLQHLSVEWNKIPNKELIDLDIQSCNYFKFLNDSGKDKLSTIIRINPYINLYESSLKCSLENKLHLKKQINPDFYTNTFDIACIPDLLDNGYKEVLIDDLSYNILQILEEERTFSDLLKMLEVCFGSIDISKNYDTYYMQICSKLEYLFFHKLIYSIDN